MTFVHGPTARQRFIFAVIDQRQIESARVFHRAPHNAGAWNRPAIIRNGDNAGVLHLAHFGEFSSFQVLCDRSDW